ncbi:MAG: UvrD-helicase domain-containing protein [Lachnospiraceae bacterium]|nr:UvrD-helicase domain-containing protein [Lachnospiraceae bacterium]
MDFLYGLYDKVKNNKEKRDTVIAEVTNQCNSIKNEIYMSTDFITSDRVMEHKSELQRISRLIEEVSKKGLINVIRLKQAREELDEFEREYSSFVYTHNEKVAADKIEAARKIIGNVEGRALDDQQMRCIVKPMHNHLVIAGAGTGKTTTIVGKVKYLLGSKLCEPQDILVLSFTNASADEMSKRINKETNTSIDASTFHKLGLNIITQVNGITPKITQINLQKFVREQLVKNMQDKKYLMLLCLYMMNNYKYAKTEFDFKSKNEYDDYLRLNPPLTLAGEQVKSYGEMEIANFLFISGIEYQYEKEYEIDTRTDKNYQYYPDFYLPEQKIYIEYFGIDEQGKVPGYFFSESGDPSTDYKQGMEWKRKLHKDNRTTLIECYAYEKMRGELTENLSKKLKDRGVHFKPLSSEEIWDQVSNNNAKDVLVGIAEFFTTIINLLKSNAYSANQFKSLCEASHGSIRNMLVADLVIPIYESYQKQLQETGEIDFNDMINTATAMIIDGKYECPYKYVIVDEYQDISKARYKLLKALRDSRDYDLFCVGDDWQSIYRFAGSDMDYIVNFSKYWGFTEYSKIETTYRFTDSLIDVSGNFVMQNPRQIKKALKGKASKVGFALGEVKGYSEKYAIQFMLKRLDELPANSSVYMIGRYTFDSKMLDDCNELNCNYDNPNSVVKVSYSKRTDLNIRFITAHRSKGLQADYVFIINNKSKGMGFPSKMQDDPVVDLLLEGQEDFPFAEERRLFYVALTRAKVKTYLVTINGDESEFAREMEKRYECEIKQEAYTCPLCGGKLEKKSGPYGKFYGCSNYKVNGCKFTRKIAKKAYLESISSG